MRRPPRPARSIFGDLHIWLQATPQQRRIWAHAAAVAQQTADHQRRLVLAHPDLAAKLVALYRLERPDQWNGYIPPQLGQPADNDREYCPPNRSPYRAVLVELVAEAARREAGGHDG